MKHKNMLENKTISKKWQKSFQENLIQRLGPEEGRALDVLGNDFFYLVDNLSFSLHEKHPEDAPLLELNETEFPWELQVFINQFLRECAQTSTQLSFFCNGLRKKLDEPEFNEEFWKILDEAYKHHFFIVESKKELLI
tara:strand:- start:60 stop:473 length:414 start_codon:yes stop_codon:yes gene_type:complete